MSNHNPLNLAKINLIGSLDDVIRKHEAFVNDLREKRHVIIGLIPAENIETITKHGHAFVRFESLFKGAVDVTPVMTALIDLNVANK